MGVLSLRQGEKETMDLSHSFEYWKQNKNRTYGKEAGVPLLRQSQKGNCEIAVYLLTLELRHLFSIIYIQLREYIENIYYDTELNLDAYLAQTNMQNPTNTPKRTCEIFIKLGILLLALAKTSVYLT